MGLHELYGVKKIEGMRCQNDDPNPFIQDVHLEWAYQVFIESQTLQAEFFT